MCLNVSGFNIHRGGGRDNRETWLRERSHATRSSKQLTMVRQLSSFYYRNWGNRARHLYTRRRAPVILLILPIHAISTPQF
jgi:hypothetical protein